MSTNLEDSVVLITSSSSNSTKKDAIGTGFVIYREVETTYLLTCAHVVEAVGGKDSVLIYGQPVTVIASSDVNDFDLAVIQVKHQKLINRPVLKLQNYSQEGTSVKAAGYYLYSEEKKRSLATIEGVLGRQKYREDQDTGERAIAWEININQECQLQKGYSGSPVVEQDSGLVIGVVTNMGTGGQIGEIISVQALEIICPWLIEKINQHLKLAVELKSEKGVDYTKLQKFLAEGKWKEADEETARAMYQAANPQQTGGLTTDLLAKGKREEAYQERARAMSVGWLSIEDIVKFPCEDLRTIDQLWLFYSNGHFGFSVQKEIYNDCQARFRPCSNEYAVWKTHQVRVIDVWKAFRWSVGWWQDSLDSMTFNLNAPRGHFPSHSVASGWWRAEERPVWMSGNPLVIDVSLEWCVTLFYRLESCDLDLDIDYTQLIYFLAKGKWGEADGETTRLMRQAGRGGEWLDVESIDNFPSKHLRIINQLWLHFSDGHFGFSIQREIYESLGGTEDYNEEVWINFCDRLGWRKEHKWLEHIVQFSDLVEVPQGYLPLQFSTRPFGASHFYHWGMRPGASDGFAFFRSLFSRVKSCNL